MMSSESPQAKEADREQYYAHAGKVIGDFFLEMVHEEGMQLLQTDAREKPSEIKERIRDSILWLVQKQSLVATEKLHFSGNPNRLADAVTEYVIAEVTKS